MALRLLGQTSISGVVFFVFESLMGIARQKKLKKIKIWPESLGAMLEYWHIERALLLNLIPRVLSPWAPGCAV